MPNKYKTEQEFLAHYNAADFDRPSVTADILIFSVSSAVGENWRRANKKSFSVLLVQRNDWPDLGKWNLPGGFVGIRETAIRAARRILDIETGVKDNVYLEQLYTFDAIARDPRMRVISIAYMALIDKSRLHHAAAPNARWFDARLTSGKLVLQSGDLTLKESDLAFDHAEIIKTGILRLCNKIEYTDIAFDMMPREFTLGELQQVYEAILGRALPTAAFRRTIAARVAATGKTQVGFGHRPSMLFRRKK